jgi:hypothetical protein
MRTYLVGRGNKTQPCDIELPRDETSVSRRHLELSVTDDGRYYLVHLHSVNFTKVKRGGDWQTITQDYVEADDPLLLGQYQTTVRHLLSALGSSESPYVESAPDAKSADFQWDPERGTFQRPKR